MSEWKSYLGIEDSMRFVDVELERKKVVKEKEQKEQPKVVERFWYFTNYTVVNSKNWVHAWAPLVQ